MLHEGAIQRRISERLWANAERLIVAVIGARTEEVEVLEHVVAKLVTRKILRFQVSPPPFSLANRQPYV